MIDSQVLDYANQLVGVVSEFERGNRETFAVSPDFFSNNLSFKYDPQAKQVHRKGHAQCRSLTFWSLGSNRFTVVTATSTDKEDQPAIDRQRGRSL